MTFPAKIVFLGFLFSCCSAAAIAQDVTDLTAAHRQLSAARTQAGGIKKTGEKIDKLLDLGSWADAAALINQERPSHELSLLQAKYLLLQSRFSEAALLVDEVLLHNHSNQTALLLKVQLLTQAWKLPEAEAMAGELLKRNEKNTAASEALGTVYLLEKNYLKALTLAHDLEATQPQAAEGFLLEVRTLFASKLGEGAEPLIKKAIGLAPLNVDCRYFYGYILWRNGLKAALPEMQGQWNFALELNPQYYLIHWHLGNGYTAASYADYRSIYTPAMLAGLKAFDPDIAAGKTADAISLCTALKASTPLNPLPYLYAGSAWYMTSAIFQAGAANAHALDSARENFRAALRLAPLLGPAHNGLAAVLNGERLGFLSFSDSVKSALIKAGPYSADFSRVFQDANYYPGKLAPAMVWSELHAAQAYLPLLALESHTFSIIPLHHTLAESMHEDFFNTEITFDNRHWMDIRGVGSGAASIEYLLAGAFHERNVLLHEFTHLFHREVLTDNQQRRIRTLYYTAMKNKATLDYYASNNEDEYFAQAYEAYFEAYKVHPLDFKSMNTRSELKLKDPAAYAFIDSLVRTAAASAANPQLLKDNYAQVYTNIIQAEISKSAPDQARLKDALTRGAGWNATYLPLVIAKAGIAIQQKDYTTAETILRNAESTRGDYAPVFTGNAALNRALFEDGLLEQPQAFDLQNTWLLKAISVEKDPQPLSELTLGYVGFLTLNSKYALALNTASEYAAHAPLVSTYLRDARDEARNRALWLRCLLGYADGLNILAANSAAKPGTTTFIQLAEAYAANKNYVQAVNTLEPLAMSLQRDGNTGQVLVARLSVYAAAAGDGPKAQTWYSALGKPADSSAWYARAMLATGKPTLALTYLKHLAIPVEPQPRSFYYQSLGFVYLSLRNEKEAVNSFRTAIDNNPFDYASAAALIGIYSRTGKNTEISQLKARLNDQGIKPGENAF